ncbi:MAG: heavy metal translocating P-type ATPase [Anaerolineales bacterium]|nr:heavy metal translocating P-type ATPase [Anaerolineales bacterium]
MAAEHTEHNHHQDPGSEHEDHKGHGADHSGHEQLFRQRFWWSTLLSIPVLVYSPTIQGWLGFSAPAFPGSQYITLLFSLLIFWVGGMPFLEMAVPEIKNRQPGMMTLISLALIVALTYSLAAQLFNLGEGFFWELVTLIDVMLLGHWLEMRSIRQASGALQELAKLMPDTANRITEGGEVEEIPASRINQGDQLLIRPGESVPADGEVYEGKSSLNESMITGESQPVSREPGDQVIAGTINGDGSLRIRVTAVGEDTALAGIMRLVDQAQESKSETQLLADRAAGWLFYIAVGGAVLTAAAWLLAVGFDVQVVKRVATMLVIACPHALGLAVPLVVAITTAKGASSGILVRDRLALEAARDIDVVIFDKTGTLTQGEFGVVEILQSGEESKDQLLELAAGVEYDSEHPLARAVVRAAEEKDLTPAETANFQAIQGRGVQADIDGQTYHLGGPRMLEQLEVDLGGEVQEFTDRSAEKVRTVLYLIRGEKVLGAFAVADVIRPESSQVVQELHALDIEVAMLTGDSAEVARAVGEELHIDQVFSEVLPEHKDQKVAELQEQGLTVAMVGDGVNDAPALTRADIGIAIGGGTDVAIESAGLILVRSNPLDVIKIIKLSSASHRKMVQNLWWAAGYNIVALPLAAGVLAPVGILLSPAVGALLMSLSTVIVAINAQLLRGLKL